MKTINALLGSKGRQVWSIGPDEKVYAAMESMARHGIGALLVMDQDALVGIVSERDYARKVILEGRSSKETAVRAIMTPKVVCCAPEATVEECMAVMTKRKIRHLPVVQAATVVGVVSIGDLVNTIIAEQQYVIEQLERYVTG